MSLQVSPNPLPYQQLFSRSTAGLAPVSGRPVCPAPVSGCPVCPAPALALNRSLTRLTQATQLLQINCKTRTLQELGQKPFFCFQRATVPVLTSVKEEKRF